MKPKGRSLLLSLFLSFLTSALSAQVPHSSHVWVISEENRSYEVVQNTMPYLMSVAGKYGLATQYYATTHNSISALMHQTAGQTVTTNDGTTATFNVDNIARQLILGGLTFRSYQESLPSAGFLGISSYPYVKRHNPLAYFTDVADSSMKFQIVPFTQLATDLRAHTTANFNWITPNLLHDAHDGTPQAADLWLSQNLPAILAAPEFQPGGDGLLLIVFDEGNIGSTPDNRCSAQVSQGCGGRVATVVIGPKVKPGYRSATWYNHESMLKTICVAMGLKSCPGAAQTAGAMSDFFGSSGPNGSTKPVVTIEALKNGQGVGTSLTLTAFATDSAHPLTGWAVYVDGALAYTTPGPTNSITPKLTLTAGAHQLHVRAWDNAGGFGDAYVSVTAAAPVVSIVEPAATAVATTFTISASATDSVAKVTGWAVYVDNVNVYQTPGPTNSISITKTLTSGTHKIIVRAWDSLGAWGDQTRTVTVQ